MAISQTPNCPDRADTANTLAMKPADSLPQAVLLTTRQQQGYHQVK